MQRLLIAHSNTEACAAYAVISMFHHVKTVFNSSMFFNVLTTMYMRSIDGVYACPTTPHQSYVSSGKDLLDRS